MPLNQLLDKSLSFWLGSTAPKPEAAAEPENDGCLCGWLRDADAR
jgi:hypothetical protein